MANGTQNGNVFRDGLSQQARALPALAPAYFSVEEHSPADLIRFAQKYATELKFFDLDGTSENDWAGFIDPSKAGLAITPEEMLTFQENPTIFDHDPAKKEWLSRPHYQLFMSFLETLKAPKAELDDLTRRHLDFYFREVLRFQPRPAEADHVHVLFEPARGVAKHLLPKGTLLHAGKDPTGKALHYATADDLLITQAKVVDVRRVFRVPKNENNPDNSMEGKIYSDESWKEGTGNGIKYHALGNDLQKAKPESLAELGFAVSSPLLDLSEGTRTITIRLSTQNGKFPADKSLFKFSLTTETKWYEAPQYKIRGGESEIFIDIPREAPAITANPNLFDSDYPVLRVLLDQKKASPEQYQELIIKSIELKVEVSELSPQAIRNDDGVLNPKGSFFPFGTFPKVGSAFTFAHRELCNKPLDNITLTVTWKNKPENFGTYYDPKYYVGSEIKGIDGGFKGYLQCGVTSASDGNLFDPDGLLSYNISLKSGTAILESNEKDPLNFSRFFKLILQKPDFQHGNYVRVLIANQDSKPEDINPPYTPEIQTLSLGYTSGIVPVSYSPSDDSAHRFYHLHPFGSASPCLKADGAGRLPYPTLLPPLEDAGNLYIGLANMEDTEEISLLLQLLPGELGGDKPVVKWSYLDHDCWTLLEDEQIPIDRTNNLLNAGLMRLRLPQLDSLAHQLLPTGLYWLRAAASDNADAAGDVVAVHAQAGEVVWQDNGNAALHLEKPLPANSIKELLRRDPYIRSVAQPYTSFAGQMPEPDPQLYTRASERLRHKQRALSSWDYEHLVLDRFPEIYKVKCLHAWEKKALTLKDKSYYDPASGSVVVVVIPSLANRAPFFPLQPRASNDLLEKVKAYLEQYAPPFAEVEVRNPRFETIRYRMDIRFHKGYEDEFYLQQLNTDLRRFLSPWAYDGSADISFGSRIYHASVIYFLENLPYVDYVANFKLVRRYLDNEPEYGCIEDEGFVTARYPDSILVSHQNHFIGRMKKEEYKPEDFKGIGYQRIGVDNKLNQSC